MSEATPAPGAEVLRLVAIMDRLRSPGGCPWDAEQTHESLVPYLLEETHELVEAIESGDHDHMAEELGDVLLQVVFHARLATEDPDHPFDIDDVAGQCADKLVRRHPHVFADVDVDDASAVVDNWERIKAEEKGRESVLDGIPAGLPALAGAAKTVHRADRAGLGPVVDRSLPDMAADDLADEAELGGRLLALAVSAGRRGWDPERALRVALRAVQGDIRQSETG